jgi:hypothetical protein
LQALIQSTQGLIRSALHADTFSLMSSIKPSDMVVDAVRALRQEKFDVLGPLTARLLNEMPRPWVDIAYDYMQAAGKVPPMPRALIERGAVIDPEFESVLAKSAKTQRIDALGGFVAHMGAAAQTIDKRILHKVKSFGLANEFAKTFDIAPDVLRSDDEAQEIANAEAEAQAQADAVAMGEQKAGSLAAVGSVKLSEPNLATAALGVGAA